MTAVAPATSAAPLLLELPGARAALSRRTPGTGAGSVSLRRRGGDPDGILDARSSLAGAVGLRAGDLVWAEQVHGAGVAVVGAGERGRGARHHTDALPGVDALVTDEVGVGVAVLAADCAPVGLVAGGVVAAVHAGRRGMVSDVVGAALAALRGLAGDAPVHAVVGPAIGGCCYEVPADLAAAVVEVEPAAASRTTWGTPSVDVRAGVVAQLQRAGVAQVVTVGACTRCAGEEWFSARRDGGPGGRADGRHALVLTPAGGPGAPPRSTPDASLD
jgi:YfiH family protein